MKERVDVRMVRLGIAASREKAQALIMAGQVYLGEKKILKASEMMGDEDLPTLRGAVDAYASRGGHKLEKAITAFEADVTGKVAMDIGAASGGFTDVLLRNGANHVYAIDVGYGTYQCPQPDGGEFFRTSQSDGHGRFLYFHQADFACGSCHYGRGRPFPDADQAPV